MTVGGHLCRKEREPRHVNSFQLRRPADLLSNYVQQHVLPRLRLTLLASAVFATPQEGEEEEEKTSKKPPARSVVVLRLWNVAHVFQSKVALMNEMLFTPSFQK